MPGSGEPGTDPVRPGRPKASGYHPAVTPLLVAAVGVVALIAAGLILRTFGPRYRIARLLATTPRVSVAEANQMAVEGRRAYVRVDGRIDADDDFEDPHHQPLVYRRVRLEAFAGRSWRPFEDHLRVVPFTVGEGLDAIAIDTGALDEGLVVVPAESVGTAADLADRVPEGTSPATVVRARIQQISSVEHAIVLGYPVADPGATDSPSGGATDEPRATESEMPLTAISFGASAHPVARMTAGRGRPLILTILEPDEAMRILAADGRGRTRVAAVLLGSGVVLLLGAAVWAGAAALLPAVVGIFPGLGGFVATALAASAEATSETGGDPRSNGQGPGLVGTPGLAILGVIAIAIVAVVVTTVYVRLTTRPTSARNGQTGSPPPRPSKRRRR